ncbi:MAG: hypothetical protein SFV51_11835 [Bryobacteraceae bacterium]|nr:hypothetical protein [Bryobacteraceae bacterium]
MAHLVLIHGLDNKPEADYLHQLWKRKLAHDDGLDVDTHGVATAMAYWADVLYESPDTNLAAYESAAGEVETADAAIVAPLNLHSLPDAEAQKLRRLAARLEVNPEEAETDVPTPEEVAAVKQERVPVPAWLRKRIMGRFVRDAHHYFFNLDFSPRPGVTYKVRDEMRRRFVDALKAGENNRPLVVVSHSMGTVIAYDCLMHEPDCPAVDGLMTIGSPLGLDEVQDFFPSWSRDNSFPGKVLGRWVNVFDPLDVVVGLDPRFDNDFRRNGQFAVEDVREDNWGTWRHSISKYLQGRVLREHLARMLRAEWP